MHGTDIITKTQCGQPPNSQLRAFIEHMRSEILRKLLSHTLNLNFLTAVIVGQRRSISAFGLVRTTRIPEVISLDRVLGPESRHY
jgi:hypothetical protein